MTFTSLVAALLLEQLRPLRSGNRIYGASARYLDWLARNLNAGQYRDGVIAWILAMVPPALITLSVYALCRHMGIVFAVLWNIVVLYLALGFRQFSHL